jgi:pimeloyl-ACP methyl ester carboxylesterase
MDPMLQFIARSGYYIVYPYIQDSVGDILNQSVPQLRRFPALGLNALSGALTQLQSQNITNVAVAGYSLGAIAAARVAAMWKEQNKSPPIRAIVLHEPAGLRPQIVLPGIVIPIDFTHANDWSSKFALAAIPCDTFLLIVQAQSSTVQPDLDNSAARKIWHNLWRIARYAGTSGNRYHRNL